MKVGLAVEELMGIGVKYGICSSYKELVRTWKDERPIPTYEELEVAWQRYQDKQAAAEMQQAEVDAKKAIVTDKTARDKLILEERVELLLDVVADLVGK